MPERARSGGTSFAEQYPTVARWIATQGWIEVGLIDGMGAFVQALDEGGLCWEGKAEYPRSTQHWPISNAALPRGSMRWGEGSEQLPTAAQRDTLDRGCYTEAGIGH